MLKTIVGIPGDRLAVTEEGVSINGAMLPGSAPRPWSSRYPQITLPVLRGEVVLQARQYWVYGGGESPDLAARSFDSRYFGPIAIEQVRAMSGQ
jgi:type IV secretory pathway protease TraF